MTQGQIILAANPMHPPEDKSSPIGGDAGHQAAQGSPGTDSGHTEAEEGLWSPPQFSLRSLIIAATALALACAVVRGLDLPWAEGLAALAILCLLGWFLVNCGRLVRLSRREQLLGALRRKRKRDLQEQRLEHARWLNKQWARDHGVPTEADEVVKDDDPPTNTG